MDERTLRQLLDDTLAGEPPMGPVARNALRAGIRIRRRRTTGAISGVAAVAAIVGLFPAIGGPHHPAGPGRPSAHGQFKGMGGHGDRPMTVAFSPNGQVLATADNDGTARLWNVATQRQIGAPFSLKGVAIKNAAFSPDGKLLASADADGTVRLWNVATRRQVGAPFVVSTKRVAGAVFSPDGRTLATVSWDGFARLWNVATRRQIGPGMALGNPAVLGSGSGFTVAFSPNGKLLLTVGEFVARIWSVANQREVGKPIGNEHRGIIRAVLSPNGKLVATSGPSNFVLWSVATQQKVGKDMPNHGFSAWGVGFTPDGKVLVTTNASGTISEWSVATHKLVRPQITAAGHHLFTGEAVSPVGGLLVTVEEDGPARLWVLSKS